MAKFSVRPKPTLSSSELYTVVHLQLSIFYTRLDHYAMCYSRNINVPLSQSCLFSLLLFSVSWENRLSCVEM